MLKLEMLYRQVWSCLHMHAQTQCNCSNNYIVLAVNIVALPKMVVELEVSYLYYGQNLYLLLVSKVAQLTLGSYR